MRRRLLPLLAAASSALALCGCASSGNLPAPLQVDLPQICELILEPVPLTPVRVGDEADSAFMAADAATIEANDRIVTGRQCLRDQRQAYRGKGPPQ